MTSPSPSPDPNAAANSTINKLLDPLGIGHGIAGDFVGALPGVSAAETAAQSFTDTAVAARRWISDRHNWVRIGWFLAGAACMSISFVLFAKAPVETGLKTATGVAKKVV